jgi:N-acetylglucosaminyldiphosphoundecaprenol N-acetyl-beta-D-mannosaminyltransferase
MSEGSTERAPTPASDRFRVLGVPVDGVQIPGVISQIEEWIAVRAKCHFVAVTGMHGVTEAQHDMEFKKILNSADMVVPDGMPLIWVANFQGYRLKRRVYGPELMLRFLQGTAAKSYRHFLYGGEADVPDRLAENLRRRFPGVVIAGSYSPPFRSLTAKEDEEIVAMINASAADVLWVGLSTPKQERWMFEHRNRLNVPVLVGVGAAFDIHAGKKMQAPLWMQEHGLEWGFRLIQEPKRLWRRYLIYGSRFLFWIALEQLGLRKFR